MLKRSRAEDDALIRELLAIEPHFEQFAESIELGSSWVDITTCAAMLCRSVWWPADKYLRSQTAPAPIQPCRLGAVRRRIDLLSGNVAVVFTLTGRPGAHLAAIRRWKNSGELHVNPADWPVQLDRVVGVYLDAKEAGRAKLRDMRGTHDPTTTSSIFIAG